MRDPLPDGAPWERQRRRRAGGAASRSARRSRSRPGERRRRRRRAPGSEGEHGRSGRRHGGQRRQVPLIRELVESLYAKHNPSKLADVDTLFQKYHGMEQKMYLRICELYNVEPDASVVGPGEARSPSRSSSKPRSPTPRPMPMKPVAKSAVRAAAGARRAAAAALAGGPPGGAAGRGGSRPGGGPAAPRRGRSRPRSPGGNCRSPELSGRAPSEERAPRQLGDPLHAPRPAALEGGSCGLAMPAGAEEEAVVPEELFTAFDDMPAEPAGEYCCGPDCRVQLCAGINFEVHPLSQQIFCHDCWFTGGIYLEVEAERAAGEPLGRGASWAEAASPPRP